MRIHEVNCYLYEHNTIHMKKTAFLFAILLLCSCGARWESLFNGKNLDGWHQACGEAAFGVADGCIVTEAINGRMNSFLATDKEYGDFILEFDFKMDEGFNSGVQFRGHINPAGRVYGYQFDECGNPKRCWTGGIYDEQRRGWLYKLTWNPEGQRANRLGEWNRGRIEAVGGHLRTFVNGVLCADVLDDADASGMIALQSHATNGRTEMEGKKAFWRNIRICTVHPERHMLPTDGHVFQYNWVVNTLSERQQQEGWTLLWDGKTMEGWAAPDGSPAQEGGWKVADGELISDGSAPLASTGTFTDFWLSVDMKFNKGASGDLFKAIKARTPGAWFYDRQWNTAWVKVKDGKVETFFNGVEVDGADPAWDAFRLVGQDGHILLPPAGDEIHFQNILIKEL